MKQYGIELAMGIFRTVVGTIMFLGTYAVLYKLVYGVFPAWK